MKKRNRYTHLRGHLVTGDTPTWADNFTRGTFTVSREEAAASMKDARKKGLRMKPLTPFN